MDTISQACQRGRTVVHGLLAFSRKGLGETQLLDLNQLVEEECTLLEHTTLARVRVVLDLSDTPTRIQGDPAALGHVLMNLCVNAVDAMPQGGTLTLRTRHRENGQVVLEIEDTGEGMSPEVLKHALDPFFTTKPQGKGTGLGLAIAYGTLQAHGGGLTLDSTPGVGTKVTLAFPPSAEVPQPLRAQAESLRARSRSVLLVDDDDLVRESTVSLLELLGHRVEAVASGEEALDQLGQGPVPDVVILDMNMPGLGGVVTLERLRQRYPDLPVLLATGLADAGALRLAAASPRTTLLRKPYTLEELRTALEALEG